MVTPPETSAQGAAHGAPPPFELATQVAQQLINLIAQEQQRRDPQETVYCPASVSNRRLALRRSVYMVPLEPSVLLSWQCNRPGTRSRGMSSMRLFGLTISLLASSSSSNRNFVHFSKGTCRVLEYMQAFIRLSQYSPEDVDTDPRRAARLLGGFDPTLLTHLGRRYDSFTELVDAAIDMEHRLREAHEDQRRNRLASTPPSSSP
ncbi:hypothetical protein U9M48_028232 [Paspalum notatum var. saurae]|uniref:Retrotransposon gag domain-containing protein n=1 Tax=Paspalum notatum var. saurae TaxID=547442 RepID=A0AAQ3U0Q9_PASNO